jgi:hypothetical protein
MQKNSLSFESFGSLVELSSQELQSIEGGSFYEDAAYVAGFTLRCLWEFCKTASEYQASLPPNLKK